MHDSREDDDDEEGMMENKYEHIINEFLSNKTANTRRSRRSAFRMVARYMQSEGVSVTWKRLANDLEYWQQLGPRFVSGLFQWMIDEGYSRATAMQIKSHITNQFRLAFDAGLITVERLGGIQLANYGEVSRARDVPDKPKPEPVLTDADAHRLKNRHDLATRKGRRDKALMHLLLDHGLRRSEVVTLRVDDVDLEAGTLEVRWHKSNNEGAIELTNATLETLRHHILVDDLTGSLINAVNRGDSFEGDGLTGQAVFNNVQGLGASILEGKNVTPHDCRHYWATKRARDGATPYQLMKEGGWTSLNSAMDYIH